MKKQELIHLHGLLAEVSSYCATEQQLNLDNYRTLGVRPTSIHQSKTDHKEAVFALAKGITSTFDTDQTDEPERIAPSAAD